MVRQFSRLFPSLQCYITVKHGRTLVKMNLVNADLTNYFRCMMEVPKPTSVAALYFNLGILIVNYELYIKQLLFLKRILDKDADYPVLLSYQDMVKFGLEANCEYHILGLLQAC